VESSSPGHRIGSGLRAGSGRVRLRPALRPHGRRSGSWRRHRAHARLPGVSHPSLGLPPIQRTAGLPPAAARVDAARARLATRALEIAIDRDPTLRERYDEIGLRRLLRDTVALIDRVVDAMKASKPEIIATNLSKDQENKLQDAFQGA